LITPVSSSIIKSTSLVQDLGVSDHSVVQAVLNVRISRPPTSIKFLCRKYKDINSIQFLSKSSKTASSIWLYPKATTNEYVVQLWDNVIDVLNELAPLKRRSHHTKSWLSRDAIDARRNRRRFKGRCLTVKSDQNRIKYRSACHATNLLINHSRCN